MLFVAHEPPNQLVTAGGCHFTAAHATEKECFDPGVDYVTPSPELLERGDRPVKHIQ